MGFPAHRASNGTNFALRLSYTARLYGDTDDCCTASPDGHRIQGWWEVPFDEDVQSTVSVAGNLISKSDGIWKMTFHLNHTLMAVATDSCPLAWDLGGRNVWWISGACLLGAAGLGCFMLMYCSDGKDAAFLILACVAVCVLAA